MNIKSRTVPCLKSFEIVTSNENVISKKYLTATSSSPYKNIAPENNIYSRNNTYECIQPRNSKFIQLVTTHDRNIMSDSLEQTDDEVFDGNFTSDSKSCIQGSRRTSAVNQYNQELIFTKAHLYNTHRNYQKLKARFHKLHADYQKLMGITGVLTTSLQKSATGEMVDLHDTLQACMRIYPDIFNSNSHNCKAKFVNQQNDMEVMHQNLKISMLSTVSISPKLLDYTKIKSHLLNECIKAKCLLLQALRWKLTLSQSDERDETMNEYIKNDLLGLHDKSSVGDNNQFFLSHLLVSRDFFIPHNLLQSVTRLLNTFASLKSGRDYLSIGPTVLNVIVQCLDSSRIKSIDAFTCNMIIATLQKLSLRKQQRLYMISAGMVEWLIYHLKVEYETMGTYRLEYATALLMNLSLQKEAQVRVSAMANVLISTLIMLLSLEHSPALPYINGALNNFLANSRINEEARIIGLDQILEYHRQYRTGELRKHLDHILLRHRRKNNDTIEENINDNDDREELDIIEDELDEMDPIKVDPGELFGESLLTSYYSISVKVLQNDEINSESADQLNEAEHDQFKHDNFTSLDTEKPEIAERDCDFISNNSDLLANIVTDVDQKLKNGELVNAAIITMPTSANSCNSVSGPVKNEADAFTAKPKISRTPLHSVSSISCDVKEDN